ncbi:MAG: hypothetical protein C0467_22665 [Planctomycetaceae bacterium]|nr:hypothetical protein [Planctomycetaceae bacterium]
MKFSIYFSLIVFGICGIGMYLGASFDGADNAQKVKDEMRWVKIENAQVFQGMGARLWRLHVPASQLDGKSKIHLKWIIDNGNPETVLTARLKQSRNASDPVDITVILYPNHWSLGLASHFALTLASDEFTEQIQVGNPLPRSTNFTRLNELGDLSTGVDLCTLSLMENDNPKVRSVKVLLCVE